MDFYVTVVKAGTHVGIPVPHLSQSALHAPHGFLLYVAHFAHHRPFAVTR